MINGVHLIICPLVLATGLCVYVSVTTYLCLSVSVTMYLCLPVSVCITSITLVKQDCAKVEQIF